MNELKPVLDNWAVKEVFFDEIGNPIAYREVPDTHRHVSVELLARAAGMLGKTMYNKGPKVAKQLRAVIDGSATDE